MKKFLLAGLGNIGAEYAETRHNIGFAILDFFARKEALTFETAVLGSVAFYTHKGCLFVLLKPTTYMNLSGKAVSYWLAKEKIPIAHLLVLADDINLPFGTIRLKTQGSHGGHNGLRDVEFHLKTQQYNRLRFGVGSDFPKGKQVEYVLGKWTDAEYEKLPERLLQCSELIKTFGLTGMDYAMNAFNGK